jgi:hypothetical protein
VNCTVPALGSINDMSATVTAIPVGGIN